MKSEIVRRIIQVQGYFKKAVPDAGLLPVFYALFLCAACCQATEIRFLVRPDSELADGSVLGQVALPCVGMISTQVSVSVSTTNGLLTQGGVLWAAQGELLRVAFDLVPGVGGYWITLSDRIAMASNWHARAGLVLETRQDKSNAPVENLAEFGKRWNGATSVDGRSFVDKIFHGSNPHGLSERFLSLYSGFFRADVTGEYEFATVSDDASFLQINGSLVAEWPGLHPVRAGLKGEHSGRLLLNSGLHRIEYAHAQCGNATCAMVAWKRPGAWHLEVVPAAVFTFPAMFKPVAYEAVSDDAPRVCFTWSTKAHTRVDDFVMSLVIVRVLAPDPGATPCRWWFGDGVTAVGRTVEHVFPKTGMRSIKLEMEGRGAIGQSVLIMPDWKQMNDWPDDLFGRQVRDFMRRDWRIAPISDAIAVAQWANRVGEFQLMACVGDALLARASEVSPDACLIFVMLGRGYWGHALGLYDLAESTFRIALDKGTVLVQQQAALQLAAFQVHLRARPDDARATLAGVDWNTADAEAQRARLVLLADAALMNGDVSGARQGYIEADAKQQHENRRSALGRQALLDTANNYMIRGEFDEAALRIQKIEAEKPFEKLRPESGLILLDVFLGRQEYQAALARSRLLEPVVTSEWQRSRRLLKTILALRALGRPAEASVMLKTLLIDYPYSEAAAEALLLPRVP